MSEAVIAQKSPYGVDVKSGKSYWWCVCGKSAKQPFCDGSHQGTTFEPRLWKADKDGKVWFCGCKHTASVPMCDGTHSKL